MAKELKDKQEAPQSLAHENNKTPKPQTTNSPDKSDNQIDDLKLKNAIEASQEQKDELAYQKKINLSEQKNSTGIPPELKVKMENLHGFSLDKVRVYYNSAYPGTLGAVALAEGLNIYLAPGQESYLSHELTHIIQQSKQLVEPTMEQNGVLINDDQKFEKEAEDSEKELKNVSKKPQTKKLKPLSPIIRHVVQRALEQGNKSAIVGAGTGINDVDARQNAQIQALLNDAQRVLGPFTEVFETLKESTNASTRKIEQQKKIKYKATDQEVIDGTAEVGDVKRYGDGRVMTQTVEKEASGMGGLKGAKRIKQKMNTKYKKAGNNAVANINDVVRGTLAFEDFEALYNGLQSIVYLNGADLNQQGLVYQIVRAKQIFSPLSSLLYGDVKLNLQIQNHNCELQLNTLEMLKGKGTSAGHGAYEIWRDLDDYHWQQEGKALPSRIGDMKEMYRGEAQRAVHASQDAYRDADIERRWDPYFYKVIKVIESLPGGTPPPEFLKDESGALTDKRNPAYDYYRRERSRARRFFNEFLVENQSL